jgi:plastocyanin
MNRAVFILFALLAASLLLPGCLGGATPQQNETNTTVVPQPPPAPRPSFAIAEPAQGDSITSTDDAADVSVTLTTSNLQVKSSGTKNNVGEGHFRARIDGGSYSIFYSKSYTLAAVPLGTHTLDVELLNNDGTPYSPAIKRSATFDVAKYQVPVYLPETYSVEVKDFAYSPADLTVKVGDSINWTNTGAYPRSATSTGNFDTKVIAPGASAITVMNKEGTFSYFSLTYMMMKGTVTVESNQTG